MSSSKDKIEARERRKASIRKRVTGTTERPRLTVFRSNADIYAQVIDDVKGVTLAAASTLELEGDATMSELPGGRVATTWHIGPYGELPKTYALLETWMKEHELEGFDSRDWRAWAHRSGQRVGLSLARNLAVGLDILGLPQEANERAHALKLRAADDPDLRDLIVFATTPAFAAARKALGFEVRSR